MDEDLRIKINQSVTNLLDEIAKDGCIATFIILTPPEKGFDIGYLSNIPDRPLRIEALQKEHGDCFGNKVVLTEN